MRSYWRAGISRAKAVLIFALPVAFTAVLLVACRSGTSGTSGKIGDVGVVIQLTVDYGEGVDTTNIWHPDPSQESEYVFLTGILYPMVEKTDCTVSLVMDKASLSDHGRYLAKEVNLTTGGRVTEGVYDPPRSTNIEEVFSAILRVDVHITVDKGPEYRLAPGTAGATGGTSPLVRWSWGSEVTLTVRGSASPIWQKDIVPARSNFPLTTEFLSVDNKDRFLQSLATSEGLFAALGQSNICTAATFLP